jgi:BMFP domain-containing protein YqiC
MQGFLSAPKTIALAMSPTLLDELSARLKSVLQSSPAQDLDQNLRAFMTGVFARMDLVTREEFDIQKALLERAQARLKELESQVAQLEQRRDD